jgi:hypothetical protein
MQMRILHRVGWIGMFLVCFAFYSIALADDSVKVPGVQIGADGSVVAPGVKVTPDGSVSAPGVEVDSSGSSAASQSAKGSGGENHFINDDSQTLNLECNGKIVTVNGDNNTINCHGKSAELNVNGDGNTIHFKGTCGKLFMNGSENTAKIERIGSITARGDDNRITWVSASKGQKPSILSTGKNNVIDKAE